MYSFMEGVTVHTPPTPHPLSYALVVDVPCGLKMFLNLFFIIIFLFIIIFFSSCMAGGEMRLNFSCVVSSVL